VAAKVRARLVAIGEERVRVKAELAEQKPQLEAGAALIRAALDLLDDPQELYRQTTDPVRRQLNHVFFDKIYLDAREVTDDVLAEPFDGFLDSRSTRPRVVHTRSPDRANKNSAPRDAASGISAGAVLLERIACGLGSSKATMVELRGIEPRTSSMRTKRATNCATAPSRSRHRTIAASAGQG